VRGPPFIPLLMGYKDLIQDLQRSAVPVHRNLGDNFILLQTVWICRQESYDVQNFKAKLSFMCVPFKPI